MSATATKITAEDIILNIELNSTKFLAAMENAFNATIKRNQSVYQLLYMTIKFQEEELKILRVLEQLINSHLLTDSLLHNLMTQLIAHREKLAEIAKQQQEKQATSAAGG